MPGCDRDAVTRGLCEPHYGRLRRNGTLVDRSRVCTICAHADCLLIESLCHRWGEVRRVAMEVGCSEHALGRHMRDHANDEYALSMAVHEIQRLNEALATAALPAER